MKKGIDCAVTNYLLFHERKIYSFKSVRVIKFDRDGRKGKHPTGKSEDFFSAGN
jgi:hypothetical protein